MTNGLPRKAIDRETLSRIKIVETLHPHRFGGLHTERSIYAETPDAQLVGCAPVVCCAVGVGLKDPINFIHIAELDARRLAASWNVLINTPLHILEVMAEPQNPPSGLFVWRSKDEFAISVKSQSEAVSRIAESVADDPLIPDEADVPYCVAKQIHPIDTLVGTPAAEQIGDALDERVNAALYEEVGGDDSSALSLSLEHQKLLGQMVLAFFKEHGTVNVAAISKNVETLTFKKP